MLLERATSRISQPTHTQAAGIMVQTGPTSTKKVNQKDQERAGRSWWVRGRKVEGDMPGVWVKRGGGR